MSWRSVFGTLGKWLLKTAGEVAVQQVQQELGNRAGKIGNVKATPEWKGKPGIVGYKG